MKQTVLLPFQTSKQYTSGKTECDYDEPETCPLCKYALKPQELAAVPFVNRSGKQFLAFLYLCKRCYRVFAVMHSCSLMSETMGRRSYFLAKTMYIGPQEHEQIKFHERIENLSPRFTKIYNQAYAADSSGLDEIAGIGYRKALEFLVKDYALYKFADDMEKIKTMPLAQCIRSYIHSPQIESLASRAAWIGNDEAHYVRKQETLDLDDMKSFIEATVYFVNMDLLSERAASIPPA